MSGNSVDDLAGMVEHPLIRIDGYDDCVAGYCPSKECLVYDANKIIAKMIAEGCSEEDAAEYFDFNIECAYVGEHTPLFIYSLPPASEAE